MQPNATAEPLSDRQQRAALMVAEDALTDQVIADTLGINKVTLERWKKRDDFAAQVTEHREAFKDRALSEGFADKRARIKALNAMAMDLMADLGEEATDLKPRGTYRLEKKISANGDVIEYEIYDKPKADSFRGYLDDIAKEMGERATKQEITGAGGEPLVLTVLGVDVERV